MACASASDCWTAATYLDNTTGTYLNLIEHWDGSSWAIVSSPNVTETRGEVLTGVTCVSASDCWAVGSSFSGINYFTLIEHWDGTSWSIVTSSGDSAAQYNNELKGVRCTSSSDCWAVGDFHDDGNIQGDNFPSKIEHWDGTAWTVVTSPTAPSITGPVANYLNAVTCVSASDCWAVGQYNAVGGRVGEFQPLIEHWDGTAWNIVTSPSANTSDGNYLNGVTCTSQSDCWSVGYYITVAGDRQTLIEQWDGSSWAVVSSPNAVVSGPDNSLNGVTCVSASECWAIGYTSDTVNTPDNQNLIERWDGTSWTIVTSPNRSATDNRLKAVTCVSASDCWAVGISAVGIGTSDDPAVLGQQSQTLTEHYGLPFVQLNAAASRKAHGSAGTFDINLPLTGTPSIECRSGGVNDQYMMVFTFANPLASVDGASVTSGTGSVATSYIDSTEPHNYIVNLSGVTNAQVLKVDLTNVSDSAGDFSSAVSASMGVLIGDVNGSRDVDSADVFLVRQQTLQTVTNSNFRDDINASGDIDSADVFLVRKQTLTSLP